MKSWLETETVTETETIKTYRYEDGSTLVEHHPKQSRCDVAKVWRILREIAGRQYGVPAEYIKFV